LSDTFRIEPGARSTDRFLSDGKARRKLAFGQERTAMSEHLGKIALMMLMTHGFRAMGRLTSPRWAGLALGLPCTTAVALIGGGSDRGIDYAVAMSSNSLIGLAGAVALPMAYARAVIQGWRLPWAILLGLLTYLVVALSVGRILPRTGEANLGVACLAVLGAIGVASRITVDVDSKTRQHRALSKLPARLLRTFVPIICLFSSLLLGEMLGAQVAGLLSTFPGMTLTVLLLTHVESGADSAVRMARALPAGNLGMVAFLAAFQFGCPNFGLVWGSILGYASALAMLTLVILFDRIKSASREWMTELIRARTHRSDERVNWPRRRRQFSPFLESFGA
jgi:hypothetical protein